MRGSGAAPGPDPVRGPGEAAAGPDAARGADRARPGRTSARGTDGRPGGPSPARDAAQSADRSPARDAAADGGTAPRRGEHPRFSDFRRTTGQNGGTPATPPPPAASARFPDAPPPAWTRFLNTPPAAPTRFPDAPPVASARFPDGPPSAGRREDGPPPASARFPDAPPSTRDTTRRTAPARPSGPAASPGSARPSGPAPSSGSARLPGGRAADPAPAADAFPGRAPRPSGPPADGAPPRSSGPSSDAAGTRRAAGASAGGAPPRSSGDAPTRQVGSFTDGAPPRSSGPSASRDGVTASGGAVPPSGPPPAAPPLRRPLPEERGPEGTPHPRPLTPERPGTWQPPSGSSRRSAEALDGVLGTPPGRPYVTFAQPDTSPWTPPEPYGAQPRKPRPTAARAAAVALCVVLGAGLIGGAAAGSWLTGDSGTEGSRDTFAVAGQLWHGVPVDELFPPTVRGEGAGPGGTDRIWTRIAVAPDSGCADAFDPLLRKVLAPVGCLRLLRATYTDATSSNVTTVGLMFTKSDAAAMAALRNRFAKDGLDRRTDLMPRPYAAEDTAAAGFGDDQRASWTVSVLTDVPVVVYAVSGFADGRTVTEPQPAEDAMKAGATTAPAQSGLGHEAKGLADRIERGLRATAASATEQPS
ncbi:hypothetical protein QBA57_33200 [Streptomyces scabiei]|uniref:hypothetical protein n=1 Tax=Streptomyces scabiei TaxID=1930 RepID=UPI001FF5B9CF|nr:MULTISPECIES: hypothetical protein [Streptomyces]MDX3285255.1 hypothetical protein [Streptomyces scabiei]MDX3468610.1 hypothetical protein [Streptomyces scabiei]